MGKQAAADAATSRAKQAHGRLSPAEHHPGKAPAHLELRAYSAAAPQSKVSSTQRNQAGPAGQLPKARYCTQ